MNSAKPNKVEKIKNELITFFEKKIEKNHVIKP